MKRAELFPLVFGIYLIRMWNALGRVIVFVEVRPNESATSMRTVVAGPEARYRHMWGLQAVWNGLVPRM